jgi:hypothetical protein
MKAVAVIANQRTELLNPAMTILQEGTTSKPVP